jgi:ectoine hydroxylase
MSQLITPTETADPYPSRIEGIAQVIPREDPVIYGDVRDNGLTEEQYERFERDGFVLLESFYSPAEVTALRNEAQRLRTSEEVRQSELAVTEPMSGETRSVFGVHTVSDLTASISRDERLLGIVETILGSKAYIHQSRVNFKPGLRGKEFYWHSDFETWHTEDGMPRMRCVSCSILLTDNFKLNGPLMLIPGSHNVFCQCSGMTPEQHYKQSLKKQEYGVPSDEQLYWLCEQYGLECPDGPAGSIVLFDCNTMHGSNGNITPFPRTNVFMVYNSIENTLQAPYASQYERPWYLANRNPKALEAIGKETIASLLCGGPETP